MKKFVIAFIVMGHACGLLGMKLSEKKIALEKMEEIKITRGETIFSEFLSYVSENKGQKDQIIERVSSTVTDVCFYNCHCIRHYQRIGY